MLRVDGLPTAALTPARAVQLSKQASVHDQIVGQIVLYLAADEHEFVVTTAELADALREIDGMLDLLMRKLPVSEQTHYARIARRIDADREAPAELGRRLGTDTANQVSGLQARAVNGFLDTWPAFAGNLTGRSAGQFGVRIQFGAKVDAAYGDGVYLNGVLKLAPLATETPGTFLRLLLHETGHATFERLLLNGRELPRLLAIGELGPVVVARGELIAIVSRPVPTGQAEILARKKAEGDLAAIDEKLRVAKVLPAIKAMSDEARSFYNAWLVLRRNGGAHLLGLDMGDRRSPAERRTYQAEKFIEFCAESFMLAATGALSAHVRTLQADGAPPDVIAAWKDAVRVLLAYQPKILGG